MNITHAIRPLLLSVLLSSAMACAEPVVVGEPNVPEFKPAFADQTRAEAEADTEHFDGKTTE